MIKKSIKHGTVTAVVACAIATASVGCGGDDETEALRVRVDVKEMSAEERADLIDAILLLRDTQSPYDASLNYYDQFVAWHWALFQCNPNDPDMVNPMFMGHGGPAFLPWHRAFLMEFENALREVSEKPLTLPYWDWTDPASTAVVFTDEFMGGGGDPDQGYALMSGPFRTGEWPVTVQLQGAPLLDLAAADHLVRRLGCAQGAVGDPACEAGTPILPTASEISEVLAIPDYDVAPYNTWSDSTRSFRNRLEGFTSGPSMICAPSGVMLPGPDAMGPLVLHNIVHGWVGGIVRFEMIEDQPVPVLGTMGTPISPADPVFFLNHANVDRIWAEWQEIHGVDTYVPANELPLNNVDDPMFPFRDMDMPATPGELADILELGYDYQ